MANKAKLSEIEPSIRIPSIRRWLLRVHEDLLKIESKIDLYSDHYPREITELELLVLALEDRRYFRHIGIDVKSIFREFVKMILLKTHGGASTIDMQFVRTATGYKERTLKRKLYEMFLSMIVQYRHNKIVILRSYLNCAFFGSRMSGIARAARKVFNKHYTDLSIDEAAFLAAMLVYPRPLNPSPSWHARVSNRAAYGMRVYFSNKQSLKKLPGGEFV